MKTLWFRILSLFGLPMRRVSVLGESVPKAIHNKFFRLYPNAYNISWYVQRGIFVSRFMDNNCSSDTYFKPDGKVLKQFKITFRKEKHLFETECDSQGNILSRVEI